MPKSSAIPTASALLISCFLSNPARSQTAPASAPAADLAKAALADFYKLMYNADPKALDLLVFTDPQAEKAGRTLLQLALAQQRVRLAALRAFGDTADVPLGVSDKDRQQFEQGLKQAVVTPKGTTAEIRTDRDGTFVAILKDGTWKIDFDKTQANMGPLPKDTDLPAITTQTETLNQLAADLADDAKLPDPAQRKFKTLPDLKARLQQISPATNPK